MPSEEVSSVRVFGRFRPTRAGHEALACNVDAELAQIRLCGKRFRFDGVLGPESTQQEAFDAIAQSACVQCLRGFNATILAYGQTGSGKTHTMLGAGFGEGTVATEAAWDPGGSVAGLMPRVVQSLFRGLVDDDENSRDGTLVELSMLEIYNEKIRDLLGERSGSRTTTLKLRETPDRGVWVEGLERQPCATDSDVLKLIEVGSSARSTARTKMNAMSSRSHVVVTVVVTQKKITGTVVKAKLHLVDLAGSERVGKTEAQGLTLREAQSINQSLSALGNCMRALTTTATKHVPFRDSKLTHLLRDSLGGNAKTTMCVCLASDAKNEDETMSTLRFGSRAKRIQCVAKLNRVGGGLSDLKRSITLLTARVEELTRENAALRNPSSPHQQRSSGSSGGESKQQGNNAADASSFSAAECEALKLQLSSVEHKLSEATANVVALTSSKSEMQKYANTLLKQLNDAEDKSTSQASLTATDDGKLLAAREAVAQERERLREWESELSAQREASSEKAQALEARAAKRERMLEDREQELHEREQDIKVTETLREGTIDQRAAEASLAQLRENLEESYAQRAAELEERAKAAEVRAAERERDLSEKHARLRQQLERLDERQAQTEARELEVAAKDACVEEKASMVADSMKRMEDADGDVHAALREMLETAEKKAETLQRKLHQVEVEGAKRERHVQCLEVQCAAKIQDLEMMERTCKRSEDRIADLENQLLSVYYGHKAQKEQDAEDREYVRKRREEAAEQERRDAALAKQIAERGSDLSATEEADTMDTSEKFQPEERKEISVDIASGESKNDDYNPFKNIELVRAARVGLPFLSPPAPTSASLPIPGHSSSAASSSDNTGSAPSSSYAVSDHELALKLFQEEKDALSRRGALLTSVTPPLPAIGMPLSHSSSPFESLREGKEFILDSDAGLHRCTQNVGFGRWNERFILLHAPTFEVVILKPSTTSAAEVSGVGSSQRPGRAVVLKRRRRIQNLSIESGAGSKKRGTSKQVLIRSSKDSKKFIFDFAAPEKAATFREEFVRLWRQSAVIRR